MDNARIAAVFEEIAELMEFAGENPFRIRAYQQGARAIRDLDESVASILADESRNLADVPGIGKTLVDKCQTLVSEGTLPQLEKLRSKVPDVLVQVARIPGLGAKKALKLHEALELKSLDDLREACQEDKVAALKGFGKKTQESILEGLAIVEQAAQRVRWATGDSMARAILDHMHMIDGIDQLEWAGSYRRGRDTVGDLDLLIVANQRDAVMDHFEAYPGRTHTIARGETKVSIRVDQAFQVDLRIVAEDEFGAALQYFTGSQAHNIQTRKIAKEQGLKINEYGVFRVEDDVKIAGSKEQEVYAAIGLPWIAPELRENRHEFEWADADQLPELIELEDVLGDLHMHTTATDGNASLREMAEAAVQRGRKYIAITDHSRRVTMANGLDADRLREQWRQIDLVREEFSDRLAILKGIECDILEAGGMDLPDDVLEEGDWIIASVHYGQKQSRDQITDRILGALENPSVTCIAHPTGRLINRRPPYEVDMDAVMQAARENGKFLELNANPARLDLNDVHLAAAKRLEIPIVISTDAHSTEGMDVMRYGIIQARRGGLSKRDVLNTLPWPEFASRIGFESPARSL